MRILRQLLLLFLPIAFLVSNARSQWELILDLNYGAGSFAVSGKKLFMGGWDGVLRSTDNGTSWVKCAPLRFTGMTYLVPALAVIGTNLFAGTPGGVFLSTNDGTSWQQAGLTNTSVQCLAVNGTSLYAGTYGGHSAGGVYLSTNNGSSWTRVGIHSADSSISALAVSGTNLYAGTSDGIFVSPVLGTSWLEINNGLTNKTVTALALSGMKIFAGTKGGGVFVSSDYGANWTPASGRLWDLRVFSLAIAPNGGSGEKLFAGTSKDIYVSTNDGARWAASNLNYTADYIVVLAVNDSNLFAGFMNGVWRRPLTELTVSVEVPSTNPPAHFNLGQNYPNPFNPSTTIRYVLPHRSHVTLTVYNTLGQQVATLLNGDVEPGNHEVQFNASKLASGVYFYRLQAGSFVDTKKLLLVK